jgi:hypothetical protein
MMPWNPPHPDSISALRRLHDEVKQRGDDRLAMLLAGVDLYSSIGREWELLEVMRKFAHDADEMVRNTPTAAQLRELYERDDNEKPEDPDLH